MSLLVVGSVAFDAIETPFGRVERTVGGQTIPGFTPAQEDEKF